MKRIATLAGSIAALVFALAMLGSCGGADTGAPTPPSGVTPSETTPSADTVPPSYDTSPTAAPEGAEVRMEGFAFSPKMVEVPAGGAVTWTNMDTAGHDVTGEGGIASPTLAQGATYSKTFDTPGTYTYECSIHPQMTGTVVVR